MAIYDTMRYIKCDVSTICVGMAASMASVLLAAGAKGKRFALPNSEILIHQPLIGGQVGLQGQTTDIKIHADHMVRTRNKMNGILSAWHRPAAGTHRAGHGARQLYDGRGSKGLRPY